MNRTLHSWTLRIGRLGLGGIFLASGLGKLADLRGTAAYMASAHMRAVPFLLAGAIVLEVLGGLAVVSGYRARWGALALLAFLVPATFLFHNFWAFQGAERQLQMIGFLKNVSIGGGLFLLLGTESREA